jgi:hypothetical protein
MPTPATPCSVGLRSKASLFAGCDPGGESAAPVYNVIGSAKPNGLGPFACLHEVLERIAAHPINRIDNRCPGT